MVFDYDVKICSLCKKEFKENRVFPRITCPYCESNLDENLIYYLEMDIDKEYKK